FDVTEHVLRGIERRLLGKKPDTRSFGRERLAEKVLLDAGHDLEKRRFARAVGSEHADLRAGKKRQPDAFEDLAVRRIDLAQVFHGENESLGQRGTSDQEDRAVT